MSAANLTLEQITALKNEINSMYNVMYRLDDQIKNIKQIIEKKKEFLITYCKHNKEIDRNCYSEHTEYICSICGMDL